MNQIFMKILPTLDRQQIPKTMTGMTDAAPISQIVHTQSLSNRPPMYTREMCQFLERYTKRSPDLRRAQNIGAAHDGRQCDVTFLKHIAGMKMGRARRQRVNSKYDVKESSVGQRHHPFVQSRGIYRADHPVRAASKLSACRTYRRGRWIDRRHGRHLEEISPFNLDIRKRPWSS